MPILVEQAKTELRRRRAAEELARRKKPELEPKAPDYGMVTLPKEELPGVWEYNKQFDDLFSGETELEDMLPLDVKYDFGRIIGMTEKPDETRAKMVNSLYYTVQLGIPPEISFNMTEALNKIWFGEKKLPLQPGRLFAQSFIQSMADKPAMMLKGLEVYTPGTGKVDMLLEKSATFLQSLKDPETAEKLQQARAGKLWPIAKYAKWYQVQAKFLPEVINAWATNVGDQIPIMLTTLAGRMMGKVAGEPIGAATATAWALATGGLDPTDVATAPLVKTITSKVIEHLGGASLLVALETGNFMDETEALKIDKDIAEKYAKIYGPGSGAIEYAQWLWVLGRYKAITKPVQNTIMRQVLTHIGGSAVEGLEEISQEGLQNWLLQKAVTEMKERHPEYEGIAPKTWAGWKRSGAIGAGVSFITALPGTGLTMAQGRVARREIVKPETKMPEVVEVKAPPVEVKAPPTEVIPAPEAPPKLITPEKAVEVPPEVKEAKYEAIAEKIGGISHITRFLPKVVRTYAEQGIEQGRFELEKAIEEVSESTAKTDEIGRVFKTPDSPEANKYFDEVDAEIQESLAKPEAVEVAPEAKKPLSELVTEIKEAWNEFVETRPLISREHKQRRALAEKRIKEARARLSAELPPKGIELWQMTKRQFEAQAISDRSVFANIEAMRGTLAEDIGLEHIPTVPEIEATTHRREIEKALKEGKPIPAEVLAEYPDLAKPEVVGVAPEVEIEKQPWEMTREEFVETVRGMAIPLSEMPLHRVEVEKAVLEGKPVRREVLEDYKSKLWAQKALKKLKPEPTKVEKRIITKDAYEAAKKRLTDRDVLRMGIDPQGFIDLATIGAYHIESGLRTFADWSKRMVEEFGEKIKPHLEKVWSDANKMAVAKKEPVKIKKPTERPIQKIIKIEKKIIPKQSKENFTPPEVQKEIKTQIPDSDSETQNAANLIEGYWAEFDERELEINVAATKNQEAITKALDKKLYLPESDIETSKMSQAMMLYIDLKEHPSGHQFAEKLSKQQKEIYEQSKSLPAKIQKIADNIIQQNREAGALAIEKDVIANARENYIAHIWEKPTHKEVLRARFRQTTARAKHRTLEGGIVEGWAKGKKLRIKDVTLATQIAQSQINQAIVGREMLRLGKKWGLLSHKQPEGWIRVEHPGFATWKWSGKAEKAKTYGRNFFVTEKGDLMERVPVYAEPELGKKLNNVFSPSALYKVPGIRTISRYNAQIKSTILFTSFYHHQAYMRSYCFGSRGLNPKKAYELGRQSIMNMMPEVRLLVRNGLTIGRIQDYDPRMIEGEQTIWGRALSHTKPTEVIRKKLVDLRKRQERFLFNRLGPALKMQAGILELKAELKRNRAELESGEITADEIAVAVANLMNNDFGGLHLGRMGRSQTAQHIFRLLALAPDWTESNIRSAVDAFRRGETGYLHRMFWGRIAIKGLGATILFNLLLSAFDDDDFAERYKKAWETGRLRWLDIDITPIYKALGGADDKRKYFSLIGHFRDPVKFTVHPFISAKHKGSVVSRIMLDMMIGQDWAGRQYTTIGELTGLTEDGKFSGRLVRYARGGAKPIEPAQIPSYALYEVRSAMPIPIQNIVAFLGGEMDAFDAITKSMGLMTATTYPKRKKIKLIEREKIE